MAAGVCTLAQDDGSGKGNHPVTNVSFEDAFIYTVWLSDQTGASYRLLSEAEWEYAARAGSQAMWSFGDDRSRLAEHAWFAENSGERSHPVGEKAPNAFGLYDVNGNVWVWVEDWYDHYSVQASDGSAHAKGRYDRRVMSGGSWHDYPKDLRVAIRYADWLGIKTDLVGFRVARDLPYQP